MSSVAPIDADAAVRYVDGKRYLWLAALSGPLIPLATVVTYLKFAAHPAILLVPLLYIYVWIPIADGIFGEDSHNPPEAAVPQLAADNYYRAILYVHIAMLYACFALCIWFAATQPLPWWAFLGFTLGVGLTSADGIIVGHELGHKRSLADRLMGLAGLSLVGYGHFRIEHNRGHHVHVATPEDSASARMGESVYRFATREIPGAIKRAWRLERERLERLGKSHWSLRNEVLMSWSFTAAIAAAVTTVFGPLALLFVLIHHAFAWYGLTQANYVEHYGLLRQKLPNGRYEPPEPRHSWNTNHVYSNLISFHLQRHSDHHANPLRPYQALRDIPDLPRLPSGYPGCFGLAAVPSMWFKVMDPKLIEWAGGDLSKLNIEPTKRREIDERYGTKG